VLVGSDGSTIEFSGAEPSTTNNRMEITAAIEALRRLPAGVEVIIRSDSQYVINSMTRGWKRRENLDLWKILDAEVAIRKVGWEWVLGHAGDAFNERADKLARSAALGKPQPPPGRLPPITVLLSSDALPSERQPIVEPKISPVSAAPDQTEQATASHESEIARSLRPLLGGNETLRRCANCGRAFVASGDPPPGQAYCSLVACQLKSRSQLPS
jgi:ribonuclease HI